MKDEVPIAGRLPLPRFIIHNSSFILARRPPLRLEQRQIIGHIHFHHLDGNIPLSR